LSEWQTESNTSLRLVACARAEPATRARDVAALREFKNILRALTFLANLKYPDPAAGDLATPAEFDEILRHSVDVLTRGVQEMNDSTKQLASKFSLLKGVKESHTSDMQLLLTQIDRIEAVDPSNAIITMQLLQNQLTASYQVTKIVSQLSLVNFM